MDSTIVEADRGAADAAGRAGKETSASRHSESTRTGNDDVGVPTSSWDSFRHFGQNLRDLLL